MKTKRHIASWVLLAVFLPMLLLSSFHIHETGETVKTECTDCVHHNCHGHLTQVASWGCVLLRLSPFLHEGGWHPNVDVGNSYVFINE